MEKIEYEFEYGFNRSSKIMEYKIGIDAARLLSTLIYKHNYWLKKDKIIKLKEGYAFFITIPNLQVETNMKQFTIKKAIKILVDNGLIMVKKIGLPATNHYILNRSKILAFEARYKNEYKAWVDKLNSMAKEDADRFIEHINKTSDEKLKLFKENTSIDLMESQLAEKSPTGELVFNPQESELSTVTNNKNTKNKKKKKKLTEKEQPEIDSDEFSNEEIKAMFSNESVHFQNQNDDSINTENDIYEDLDILLKYLRVGIITPKKFFSKFKNEFLSSKFKSFTFSIKDEALITDLIIDNPMFKENSIDNVQLREEIENIKDDKNNITDDDLYELLDIYESDFNTQHDIICEKIYRNYERIKNDKLKARFGNLFVGIKEMSENYAPTMV